MYGCHYKLGLLVWAVQSLNLLLRGEGYRHFSSEQVSRKRRLRLKCFVASLSWWRHVVTVGHHLHLRSSCPTFSSWCCRLAASSRPRFQRWSCKVFGTKNLIFILNQFDSIFFIIIVNFRAKLSNDDNFHQKYRLVSDLW